MKKCDLGGRRWGSMSAVVIGRTENPGSGWVKNLGMCKICTLEKLENV